MMTSFYYLIVLYAYGIYVICLVAMYIASIPDGQYSLLFVPKNRDIVMICVPKRLFMANLQGD